MNPFLRDVWITTLATQGVLAWKISRRMLNAYPLFFIFLLVDLIYELAMFGLANSSLALDPYTAAWGVVEIALVAAQILVCYEAVKRIHAFLPLVQVGAATASVILSLGVWRLVRAPQHFASWLEPAAELKAIAEMMMCVFLGALLIFPLEWKILRGLEARHIALLAAFLCIDSLANLASVWEMSRTGFASLAPRMAMTGAPAVFYIGWLVLFWKSKPSKAPVEVG